MLYVLTAAVVTDRKVLSCDPLAQLPSVIDSPDLGGVMTRSCILAVAVLMLLLPIASVSGRSRTVCCHGCGSKYCNHTNCGDKCKLGPDCRGCWKGCER